MSRPCFAAGVSFLCLVGCETAFDPPQDREVRALFTAHRADFEKVRDMLLADSTPAIQISPDGPKVCLGGGDWRDLSGQATPRQEEYLRLLRGLGASRVDRGWGRDDGDVAFIMYSFGNVADSYTKRVIYSRKPPVPLRPDTDTPEFNRDNTRVYSKIADDWYIEKERD